MNRPKTPDPLSARQMEALRAQFAGQGAGPAIAVFLRYVGFPGRGDLLVSKLPDERQQEAMAALKAIAGKV